MCSDLDFPPLGFNLRLTVLQCTLWHARIGLGAETVDAAGAIRALPQRRVVTRMVLSAR